jgi:hypothetical protein
MYTPVFSASNRIRSGSKTALKNGAALARAWLMIRKELEAAVLTDFDPETQAYVLGTKPVYSGLQWELYKFTHVSRLLSIRGRLEHRERRRRGNRSGFDHTVIFVKKDPDGNYVIHSFMPLTLYLWENRVLAATPQVLHDFFPENAQ